MVNLWKRWWFRAIMGVVAVPFVTTPAAYLVVFALVFLSGGYLPGGEIWEGFAAAFPVIALIEIVLTVPPWIAMEIGNRRRKRPLPPGLTTAWMALSAGLLVAFTAGLVEAQSRLYGTVLGRSLQGAVATIVLMVALYVGAVVVAWLSLTPLVARWRTKIGREVDSVELF